MNAQTALQVSRVRASAFAVPRVTHKHSTTGLLLSVCMYLAKRFCRLLMGLSFHLRHMSFGVGRCVSFYSLVRSMRTSPQISLAKCALDLNTFVWVGIGGAAAIGGQFPQIAPLTARARAPGSATSSKLRPAALARCLAVGWGLEEVARGRARDETAALREVHLLDAGGGVLEESHGACRPVGRGIVMVVCSAGWCGRME